MCTIYQYNFEQSSKLFSRPYKWSLFKHCAHLLLSSKSPLACWAPLKVLISSKDVGPWKIVKSKHNRTFSSTWGSAKYILPMTKTFFHTVHSFDLFFQTKNWGNSWYVYFQASFIIAHVLKYLNKEDFWRLKNPKKDVAFGVD